VKDELGREHWWRVLRYTQLLLGGTEKATERFS
jgi:hypothetical protein